MSDMSAASRSEAHTARHRRRTRRYRHDVTRERSAVSVARLIAFSIFGGVVFGVVLWIASDVRDRARLTRTLSAASGAPVLKLATPARSDDDRGGRGVVGTSAATIDGTDVLLMSADERAVRQVLARYRAAYSELDPYAARQIYPAVDVIALTRAFDQLAAQELDFESCAIEFADDGATAACVGEIWSALKSGEPSQSEPRRWRFRLQPGRDGWAIVSADVAALTR